MKPGCDLLLADVLVEELFQTGVVIDHILVLVETVSFAGVDNKFYLSALVLQVLDELFGVDQRYPNVI